MRRNRQGLLTLGGVALDELAREHGTPLYVYDAGEIVARFRALRSAAGRSARLAYSVKANGSRALLRLLAGQGAWFDIVSGGELERVRRAGIDPSRVIFAGVGKSGTDITTAIRLGVGQFNVESAPEAERITACARRLKRGTAVALRINPDVMPDTHEYISTGHAASKFGISFADARALIARWHDLAPLRLTGLHAHIGSQVKDPATYESAARAMESFAREVIAAGHQLETINLGGGFGIAYRAGEDEPDLKALVAPLAAAAKRLGLTLVLEPGRRIVGPAGILLTRVEYVKQSGGRTYAVVDAAMTELMRPALYSAWHEVVPVRAPRRGETLERVDVVGPVCESGDFLARDRELPLPAQGDLLAVLDCGAYAASMGSNYNSRPYPAEVLIEDGAPRVIRKRQKVSDLLRQELP